MADSASARSAASQRLFDARNEWGWSQTELAAEVAKKRAVRNCRPVLEESLRRQIVAFENGARPGPEWRSLLAEALQVDEDYLFGLTVDIALPLPQFSHVTVDRDFVDVLLDQQAAYYRAEHMLGPAYVRDLVDHSRATIEKALSFAPPALRDDVRRAAGLYSEFAGWIAQDSGDYLTAAQHTNRAHDLLRAAEPTLRAMILMRRSNVVIREDPFLAVDLAADAARLIQGKSVGRLAASIARQQALAAVASRDSAAFREHAERALDLAAAEPVPDDRAVYAHTAYVAAELSTGFLATGDADVAAELLLAHESHWNTAQRRDRAVAGTRLLRILIVQGDYRAASRHLSYAVDDYRAAPSDRARQELRVCRKIIRDRARSAQSPDLQTLRTRINTVLQEGAAA